MACTNCYHCRELDELKAGLRNAGSPPSPAARAATTAKHCGGCNMPGSSGTLWIDASGMKCGPCLRFERDAAIQRAEASEDQRNDRTREIEALSGELNALRSSLVVTADDLCDLLRRAAAELAGHQITAESARIIKELDATYTHLRAAVGNSSNHTVCTSCDVYAGKFCATHAVPVEPLDPSEHSTAMVHAMERVTKAVGVWAKCYEDTDYSDPVSRDARRELLEAWYDYEDQSKEPK